jgi:hypothetical protein
MNKWLAQEGNIVRKETYSFENVCGRLDKDFKIKKGLYLAVV